MTFRTIAAACLVGLVGLTGCETVTDIEDVGAFEYEGVKFPVKRIKGTSRDGDWYTYAVELPDGRLARCRPTGGKVLKSLKDCFPSFGGAIEEYRNPTTPAREEGGMY